MKSKRLIFGDESGDAGMNIEKGSSRYFTISFVIFDDCLSAVDARTEKKVLNNLNIYLKDKTAIIITHRIFSLFDFDKIIVLDEGKIVEQGHHISLLQQNGYYAEMYARQQKQEHS